jgi:hypothetical protein
VSRAPGHDHIDELLAVDALGGLDESGQRELERRLAEHEPGCAECARLRAAHAETAAALALSLDPVPMSPGAEERLIALARTVQAETHDEPLLLGSRPDDAGGRPRRRVRRMAVAVLAAAACLVAAGFIGYALHRPPSSSQAVAAFAEQPGTRSTRIVSGPRRIVLYYRPGQGAALVVGSGFPAPPSGHVYELWYLPVGSQQMAPAGIFVPRDGSFVAPASVRSAFKVVAVSIEPHFVPAPTGPVVLSSAPPSS